MDKMKNGAVLRNGTQRTAKEVFEKYAIVIAFLALLIVVSILNYLIFFWSDLMYYVRHS